MNHEKENVRTHKNVSLTNKWNKDLSLFLFFLFFLLSFFFFFFCWYQTFNKNLITAQNATHYKVFITVFAILYQRIKNFLIHSVASNKMFILSFSISYVCLVVTFLILCIIPLWDSVTAHSPSSKELNPSSQEDSRFSGRCTSAYIFYFILRHSSLRLSNSSLTLR